MLRRLAAGGWRAWPEAGAPLEAMAAILSGGPELGRLLAAQPDRLDIVLQAARASRAATREELAAELAARSDGLEDTRALGEAIARFRNDHLLRLAVAELGSAALEHVGRQLATLADVCLDCAVAAAVRWEEAAAGPARCTVADGEERRCELAVMAMGKLGAEELNFCSDIDIVFVYRSDCGAAGSTTLHEHFTRVCRQAISLLSAPTAEGSAYRVDLRLRPEGSRGPLCNSLEGTERYYEAWGTPFDRLAWLKARPAAGDRRLGQEMLETLRPFVFPRSISTDVITHIHVLVERIRRDQAVRAIHRCAGWDVKLGEAGIREIELFVQALQLLHAGKRPALQERSTLRALDRLLFLGLISEREQRELAEAYELLRRIEHRLQLHSGRQTHFLPASGELHDWLAAHLGLSPAELDQRVARCRSVVREVFATLDGGAPPAWSGEPAATAITAATAAAAPAARAAPAEPAGRAAEVALLGHDAGPVADPDLMLVLDPELPAEQAEAVLAAAGFAQPGRALERLGLLASRPSGPFGRRRPIPAARLARPLLQEMARSPDPDAALLHLVDLVLRWGQREGIWAMLAENRAALRLLVSLFGTSDYLARLFVSHPELLDQLLLAGRARARRTAGEQTGELAGRLERIEAGDAEGLLNEVRRFRNEELLRVGLHDIAGGLTLEAVWQQLSDLADTVLGQVYPLVLEQAERRYGAARHIDGTPASMAVIGLGKLGGRELGYGSDLDIIFIYSLEGVTAGPRRVSAAELFTRVAQRLINALSAVMAEGRLYEVDTRLRPSGRQGTLVSSWQAFRDYHLGSARTWERQVLIKARAVAGDPALGRVFESWVGSYLFGGDQRARGAAGLAAEIRHLRRRFELELAAEDPGFVNLKTGRGGLLDVELAVQYLQLEHGGREPRLRQRSTMEALAALGQAGLLEEQTARTLSEGYRFLRRIESRLRIVRDRSAEKMPLEERALELIARRLGYRGRAGRQLLDEYRERTEAVRRAFEEILPGDDGDLR